MLTSNQTPSSNPVAANAPLSAIGQTGASNTMPGTGSSRSASNNSSFMGKMKMQYVLGGLLVALIAVGSGVGFWLSQQGQDVRQQAAVDDEYGTTCVGSTPVKCSCNVCGSSQADCNNKCGTGPTSPPTAPPTNPPAGGGGGGGCTQAGQCIGGNICSPTDAATGASRGSGASCGGANDNGNCGANGQAPCVIDGVGSCDAGLVNNGGTCRFPNTTGCNADSGRDLSCNCSSGSQCASGVCGSAGFCVPQQTSGTGKLGDACTAVTDCASGYCDAGVCKVAPSNACSTSNPTGICTVAGQVCQAGICSTPRNNDPQCSGSTPIICNCGVCARNASDCSDACNPSGTGGNSCNPNTTCCGPTCPDRWIF